MKIGGHLSISGGFTNPLRKTIEIGGNCLQIFSSSPRNWGVLPVTDEQITEFLKLKAKLAVDPVYFHASYLINLANPGRGGEASVKTLIQELTLAEKMDIRGSIIHLGSYNSSQPYSPRLSGEGAAQGEGVRPPGGGNSYQTLLRNIAEVLTEAPSDRYFIIENAGNKKIGQDIDEIASIISDLQAENVRVCLDTCHLFAAGYDLSTEEKYQTFFAAFDVKIGLKKLEVIQVNDSKDTLGSGRDRHENIGEGNIPPETFRLYVNEQETKNLPFILEVPGENKKGPDKKNLDAFKAFGLSSHS